MCNYIENEGQLGTRICLKDFKDLYEQFKSIPDYENEMFVSDCFTETKLVKGEIQHNFRIFFTTKKLLSFTLYVSMHDLLFVCYVLINVN